MYEIAAETMDDGGNTTNLHQHYLEQTYGPKSEYTEWFEERLGSLEKTPVELLEIVSDTYERGLSCLDLMDWVKKTGCLTPIEKHELNMEFHKIRSEYKCEKLLLFTMCMKIPIRFNA